MRNGTREILRLVSVALRVVCAAFLFWIASLSSHALHAGTLSSEPFVDIKTVEPTILVELRYATHRNVTGQPIYAAGTPCLVRRSVAERLRAAQYYLRKRGFGLKIWDAYRPVFAQRALFDFTKDKHFVADPDRLALHTWGVAVDATLVDAQGKDVPMPTDFDDFSPAAAMHYAGENTVVAQNLKLLQHAMGSAGFYGMHQEWWHFIARNWRDYTPKSAPTPPRAEEARLAN